MDKHENYSVKCTVCECKHHSPKDHCTLECICVGTHENHPTMCECTDCESFQAK